MENFHGIVRKQFDSQAENFSNWSVTKNTEYQKAYADFCELSHEDTLLDVACGTGDYAIYTASLVKEVNGVDISRGMIDVARCQAAEQKASNVRFFCHPVEHMPFHDNTFSFVMCRSACHHFPDADRIFQEMIRCCTRGGRISVQDIVAYPDEKVNDFFEQFEKAVDRSHHKTLSTDQIKALFIKNEMDIAKTFELTIELNVREYIGHAKQSENDATRICEFLEYGLADPEISSFFMTVGDDLYFKRNVFLILGRKNDTPSQAGRFG